MIQRRNPVLTTLSSPNSWPNDPVLGREAFALDTVHMPSTRDEISDFDVDELPAIYFIVGHDALFDVNRTCRNHLIALNWLLTFTSRVPGQAPVFKRPSSAIAYQGIHVLGGTVDFSAVDLSQLPVWKFPIALVTGDWVLHDIYVSAYKVDVSLGLQGRSICSPRCDLLSLGQ